MGTKPVNKLFLRLKPTFSDKTDDLPMKPFCFANDRIVPSAQASMHPLDIGLIRGYAIFDFFRTHIRIYF